ncbi:hypothetical protein [Sphingobacterium hungaricum]|uniref:Uncharacterized protein n=1 Tax=Sphingobacterium hungaricum TaxID=2082723 RepID=A0A928YQJ2_9SPHI|nr:hypothetical protein [Sphingobacterium hungaricum]MBE8713100.1 hypothetical protein [Sphingobacterium hungaricum]
MKLLKLLVVLVLPVFFSLFAQAQEKSVDYNLLSPEGKISNSLYNELRVYDSRERKSDLGIVQKGMFNAKRLVVPLTPITKQIETLFGNAIDSTAQDGKLILQLIKFDLAEVTGSLSEKGYFDIRAILYENNDGQFSTIAQINDKIVVSGMDVTRALTKKSSQVITDFIIQNCKLEPKLKEELTADALINLNEILKSKLPLYTSKNLVSGVFMDWESFKNQVPSKEIFAERDKKGNIKAFIYLDENNKKKTISWKNAYAYTYENESYLVTKLGTYQLFFVDNDYIFDGYLLETVSAGSIIGPSIAMGVGFGAIGVGVMVPAGAPSKELYRLKLDPFDGSFIKVSKYE